MRATGTEAEVCRDIAARQLLGKKKYGTTVAENPLSHRDWLQHAYEEALDLAVYLKRAISEIDRGKVYRRKHSCDRCRKLRCLQPVISGVIVCGKHATEYLCRQCAASSQPAR